MRLYVSGVLLFCFVTPLFFDEKYSLESWVSSVFASLILILYPLPWLHAIGKKHPQAAAIGVLNLLLGWTVLGWIGAAVWASTAVAEPEPPTEPPKSNDDNDEPQKVYVIE